MRVFRGRADQPAADRAVADRLLSAAAEGIPSVRVWAPPRQVAFGRRDTREETYGAAARAARNAGFVPLERDVGGRAVAYTGDTLAFAAAMPTDIAAADDGIEGRYNRTTETVVSVLDGLGSSVSVGEPAASFCPGDHSIRVEDGGKLSGIAQRVTADAVVVAGCLIVTPADAAAIRSVLSPVYGALSVPFDPASVGSVADGGGSADTERVARALEASLVRLLVDEPVRNDGRPAAGDADVRREIVRVGSEPR